MNWFRYAEDHYAGWLASQLLLPAAILVNIAVVIFMGVHLMRRSAAQPAPLCDDTVPAEVHKYDLGARLYHWGNAIFVIVLIVSGAALLVPGSLRPVVITWLRTHELFAGLFTAGVIIHAVAAPLLGDGRSMWIDLRDWRDVRTIAANFLGRTRDYPCFGKYDPLQKLYHAFLTLATVAVVITGIFLALSAETLAHFSHSWLRWMRLIHDVAGVTFCAFVLGHIYFGLIRANWPELRAIFSGAITGEHFRRRHSKLRWHVEK